MIHEIKKQAIRQAIRKYANISYRELADIFGVSREFIQSMIREEELPRRSRGAGSPAWRLRRQQNSKAQQASPFSQAKTARHGEEMAHGK